MSKPIDLDQFEGHTPGPWSADGGIYRDSMPYTSIVFVTGEHPDYEGTVEVHLSADRALIEAAPALLSELREARAVLARAQKWIVSHKDDDFLGDHACKQCHPQSDILVDGFACAFHEALRDTMPEPPYTPTTTEEKTRDE